METHSQVLTLDRRWAPNTSEQRQTRCLSWEARLEAFVLPLVLL